MFISVPVDSRGNTTTVNVSYIAFTVGAPRHIGGGTLIHMGVRVLGYEKRVRLAQVYTTMSKERVDSMIEDAGADIRLHKSEHMFGRGNC